MIWLHLQDVGGAVSPRFRPVAWLDHAHDKHINSSTLSAAALTRPELPAIDLLAGAGPARAKRTWLGFAPSQQRPVAPVTSPASSVARLWLIASPACLRQAAAWLG